jgi:hypothetical protein
MKAGRSRGKNLFAKFTAWLNRRQFYTFQKGEEFTSNKQFLCLSNPNNYEDEWNNESESDSDGEPYLVDHNMIRDFVQTKEKKSCSATDRNETASLKDVPLACKLEQAQIGSKPMACPSNSKLRTSPPLSPLKATSRQTDGRDFAVGSPSGSLESMDSLVESQWGPDDDSSNVTPVVTNIPQPTLDAFFVEHVRFLQIQTQPRKVAEIYHDETEKRQAE